MVTATGTTPTDSPRTGFGLPSVEEATDRMRSLVEEMVASSKKVGLDVVDAQEKALQGLVALERKIPTARHLGWVSTVVDSHTAAVSEMSASLSQAARDLLK
jgi:hypothetical protein